VNVGTASRWPSYSERPECACEISFPDHARTEREKYLAQFHQGDYAFVRVRHLNEGWDCPDVEVLDDEADAVEGRLHAAARSRNSPSAGKDACYVIDFVIPLKYNQSLNCTAWSATSSTSRRLCDRPERLDRADEAASPRRAPHGRDRTSAFG